MSVPAPRHGSSPDLTSPRRASPSRQPRALRRASLALFGALLFSLPPHAHGQQTPAPALVEPVRDLSVFFQNRDLFNTPRSVDISLRVLYYDPSWRVLWCNIGPYGVYLRVGEQPMNLRWGSRYRIRGTLASDEGLYAPSSGIELLDQDGPPTPLEASDRLHESTALGNQWVRVEAYVERVEVADREHLRLSALVRGRRVNIRLHTQGREFPNCTGSFIEAVGVYSYSAPVLAAPANIDLWCPAPECIQIKNTVGSDARYDIVASPIESLRNDRTGGILRIVGVVHRQDPGRSLSLRDKTGQALVLSEQNTPVPSGALVEAVGKVQVDGATVKLVDGIFRVIPADSVPDFALPDRTGGTLRYAEQVTNLSADEAKKNLPVELNGVVTWSRAIERYVYLQDATGGIRINLPPGDRTPISFGAQIRVFGTVQPGAWLPEVSAQSLRRYSESSPGQPRQLTLDLALTGVAEGQWTDLTGFVREVNHEGPWTYLSLTTASGEFRARLPEFSAASKWVNSVVRVRGVSTSVVNNRGETAGILMLLQSPEQVLVEAALPSDLRSLPLQPIGRLHARGTRVELNRWVRIQGVVTYLDAGNFLYLQDGQDSIRALCRETELPLLGETIELVGLLGREAGKQVLREARVLGKSTSAVPPPAPATASDKPDRNLDGRVTSLTGTVVNVVESADQRRVMLEVNGRLIECALPGSAGALPRQVQPGALVEATGIYHVELNDYREPRHFRLLLRGSSDLEVRTSASWWNLRRALLVSTGLLGVSLGVIAWVALLRRTVRRQTQELVVRRDKEARLEAELERSSRLESLGMLAGGLAHDFNNLLTVVVGNLTLASLEAAPDSKSSEFLTEAEKAALRARELTQQLLTFSRGGDPVRRPHRLPALVTEATSFALSGSPVQAEFDLAENLPPASVDKAQLSQAINNLVLHAAQALGQTGRINFSLRETQVFEREIPNLKPGTYLKLVLNFQGPLLSADHLSKLFDPYFAPSSSGHGLGLATVRSIVLRHEGHVDVTSRPGQGTSFLLWLPTTHDVPAEEKAPSASPARARSLRVLFMDDDESIRKFAQTVLKRLGHEPTLVSDGTAAIHTYAAAWEANQPFDVAILDLTVVGGMGGKEAMEHLLNIDPHVRAIVSSGYSSDPVLADYRSHGFAGMVTKPYKIAELEQTLNQVVGRETQPPL